MDNITSLGYTFILGAILLQSSARVFIPCILVGVICGHLMPALSVRSGLVIGLLTTIPFAFLNLGPFWTVSILTSADVSTNVSTRVYQVMDFTIQAMAIGTTYGLGYLESRRRLRTPE